ncbi:phosphotransferase [Nocardia sp. BMG111209]|uniref:DUF7064 domain-containing protein n=1 Tax=Nocardia sp. BMG111209 TaxID=1160137 RepID=UPI00037879EE|nr:phosphotransferase [Nocardia sp. BMG111209]
MQQHFSDDLVLERPTDLGNEWLTAALGAGEVVGFRYERIGTGQVSDCYRVDVEYAPGSAGPRSVVLKVASEDPTSRQSGMFMGLYESEVRFYREIAPRLRGGPIAPCYHAAIDTGTGAFDLLLGDAAPAVAGDEIRGATVEQAFVAVRELGRWHALLHAAPALPEAAWLERGSLLGQTLFEQLYRMFLERYGERLTLPQRAVCDRLVASFDVYLANSDTAVRGLIHGDYRLDNLLFGAAGSPRPLMVVDWQGVMMGPALNDLAYFLGGALPDRDRRIHYDDLLRAYHEALGPDPRTTLAEIREAVRHSSFAGVTMSIAASVVVERTDRGDELFMTTLARHCAHVLDTGALDLLEMPDSAPPRPAADDDGPHPSPADPLWSESWYADFADPGQGLGGWVRLGIMPNERTTWLHLYLCGPGLPTIVVAEILDELPADPWSITTDRIEFAHTATIPLHRYRVTLRGRAASHDDPAGVLRGDPGVPVEVDIDLTWTTAGVPYGYRITSRYELPCTVSGTVVVDGRVHTLDGVAGQRDHSWGVRDWWAMDWTWSALHLDDGSHLHAVEIRIPGVPGIPGVGYLQRPGEPLTELTAVTARETLTGDGLVSGVTLAIEPGNLVLDVDVRGQAPVPITAADGRVSRFLRTWGIVTTTDGCRGVGWLECNQAPPPSA